MPRITTAVLQRIAYKGQRSKKPKSAGAPDSLFEPLPGYDRVEGEMSDTAQLRRTSLYTWLRLRPAARLAITGLAVGVAAGAALAASGALAELVRPARRLWFR